jgi:tungstate transport system substrate-binding protein
MQNVTLAFEKIALTGAKFASRSDNSGTHSKELSIWREARLNPEAWSGKWYFETGSGMGTTLNTAVGMSAYTLVDRASWHSFSNKHDFQIIMEGDKRLFNPYGIMLISKEKCPSVKSKEGQLFIDWLISDKGQKIIGQFTINERRVFNPHSD